MSRLTWSKPAALASLAAAKGRPGVCARSKICNTCEDADCIPRLTRVKPAPLICSKHSGEVDSGFDSVVISAPGELPKLLRAALRTRVSPAPPNREEVPAQ